MESMTAWIERDSDGSYLLTFPGLPGATFGATLQEAQAHGRDLLESILMDRMADRADLPKSKKVKLQDWTKPFNSGYYAIPIAGLSQLKLALYLEMRAKGIRKAKLARLTGLSATQVDRLLNLKHESKLELLELAICRLGLKLHITLLKAA